MPRVPQADPGANNPMSQRNYACDNIIMKYFGGSYPADFDAVGELVLKRQLWQWGTPTHNLPTHRLHMQLAKCSPALWPAVCALQYRSPCKPEHPPMHIAQLAVSSRGATRSVPMTDRYAGC